MKSSKYLEELRTKSAAELKQQLVAAKKELFNLEIPERNQSVGQYWQESKKLERILPEFRPLSLRRAA